MVRVRVDVQLKFHNRRTWREVVAAVQQSVPVPDLLNVLKAGARRRHAIEAAPPSASTTLP